MKILLQKLLGLGFLSDIADKINGNKTITGIISLILYTLQAIPTVFADAGLPIGLADNIQQALLWMGVVLVPVGLGHKAVK